MKQLKKIMSDIFRLQEDQITEEQSIHNTVAWDSLKHMELIVAIEEAYGLKLNPDEIVAMVNMSTIKRILREKGAKISDGPEK